MLLPKGQTLDEVMDCRTEADQPIHWPAELERLTPGDSPDQVRDMWLMGHKGESRLVEVFLARLDQADGCVMVVVRDATIRASMECRLATSERLARWASCRPRSPTS